MESQQFSYLVQDVLDGNESALNAYAIIKNEKNHLEKCLADIEPIALDEASAHAEKSFNKHGHNFEFRNGARRFNYKHIYEWREAKSKLEDIEMRARQSFDCIQKGLSVITDDGEFIDAAHVTYSKDSLIVKR